MTPHRSATRRRRLLRSLAACVLALATARATLAADGASDARAALEAALADYATAQEERDRAARLEGFARAERGFARAIAAGAHNATIHTNHGNAALQAGHLGVAVLAYRRALELDRGDARALQNLEHARASLPSWVPRPEHSNLLESLTFYRGIGRATRSIAAAAAFALAGALFAIGLRTGHGAWRAAGAMSLVAWVLLAASLALDARAGRERDAVVTVDEAAARAADSSLAPLAFPEPLPAGSEIAIVEERDTWIRARLANGREVWLAASSAERVVPR